MSAIITWGDIDALAELFNLEIMQYYPTDCMNDPAINVKFPGGTAVITASWEDNCFYANNQIPDVPMEEIRVGKRQFWKINI